MTATVTDPSPGKPRVGELFVLGFRGPAIPEWLREFEREFGLGGVILFDYNCQTRAYENNVQSPEQVRALCHEISRLPSKPLLMVDQEGGKVRRLKEKLGFAPLPSAKAFNKLSAQEKRRLAVASFKEQRGLGFHYDLMPVIDLDYNPANPDLGAVERAYTADIAELRADVEILSQAAREAGLGLCLKHYPGLGAAKVNSHEELTDLSGLVPDEQIELFYELGRDLPGQTVLISHGILREWDPRYPVSMSPSGLRRLREKLPEALLISDDLQMQGLQKMLPSREASTQGIRAGLDLILIGNNLMAEDGFCLDFARHLAQSAATDAALEKRCFESVNRVQRAKRELGA
jgi:beta-N-acetylhexosaminidase